MKSKQTRSSRDSFGSNRLETQTDLLPSGLGGMLGKFLLSVAIGVCIVLGLIGLVLPIIPGVLFLLFAVYLLTRLSQRAAEFVHERTPLGPMLKERRWQRQLAGSLSIGQRLRLTALYAAKGIVSGMEWLLGEPKRKQSS